MSPPDLFQPFLARRGIVILDGGLATELERRGADLRDPLWSAKLLVENPALIRAVHRDYIDAGADLITTASYQATIPGLQRRGLSWIEAVEILRLSVELATQARDEIDEPGRPRPLVAASVGCHGAFLHDGSEYRGDYGLTAGQLRDWHRPRVEIFADSKADLLAFETIPCLVEAEAIVRLMEEFPRTPYWISFSCQDETRLCHGELFNESVRVVEASAHVVAVGVNCTSPLHIDGLLASVADTTAKPLIVYPNLGEAWDAHQQAWTGGSDACDWGDAARRWYTLGARLIGGCCRTTPDTIRRVAEAFPVHNVV
jgi:homocysteine S-methyltransferase